MEVVRILIVDDHKLFRQGLISLLKEFKKFKIVGEAEDGFEALEKTKQLKPDVVLMDLRMPRCGGVEAAKLITTELPSTNIAMLTVSEKDEDLFEAIKAGAKGYLLKNLGADELAMAVGFLAEGQAVIWPPMATKLLAEFSSNAEKDGSTADSTSSGLTERETETLRLLAKGLTCKQIADEMSIAETTVRTHLRNIMEKLHIHNRLQAVAFAVKTGLVK